VWTARSLTPGKSFQAGAEVVVHEIRGVAALVTDPDSGQERPAA